MNGWTRESRGGGGGMTSEPSQCPANPRAAPPAVTALPHLSLVATAAAASRLCEALFRLGSNGEHVCVDVGDRRFLTFPPPPVILHLLLSLHPRCLSLLSVQAPSIHDLFFCCSASVDARLVSVNAVFRRFHRAFLHHSALCCFHVCFHVI